MSQKNSYGQQSVASFLAVVGYGSVRIDGEGVWAEYSYVSCVRVQLARGSRWTDST